MAHKLYGGLAMGITLLYGAILGPAIGSTILESDLWWMIPTVFHEVQGKSIGQILAFLFSPAPVSFGQPILKVYLFLVTSGLGWHTTALVGVSVALHFVNAGLLYLLARRMNLSRLVGFASGMIYLVSFSHFHAIFWPTAFQHLASVFTILLVLNLYWKWERRVGAGVALLLGGAASLLWRSVVLAPLLMLTHLLFCSASREERQARFDQWLPFFLAFSLYPILAIALVGDVIVNDALVRIPLHPALRYLLLLGGAWGGLFLIRAVLRASVPTSRFRAAGWILLGIAGAGGMALLVTKDSRLWLLPYHVLVPLSTTLMAFLEPFHTALQIHSAEANHLIPPQVSPLALFLSLTLVGTFLAFFRRHRRLLGLLLVWYAFTLIHLLHQYSSLPVHTPSRYFVYLTPVLSLFLGLLLVEGVTGWTKRLRWGSWGRHALLAPCLLVLAVSNLAAIRLGLFRGRLANTFILYDDLRAAELIRQDLQRMSNPHPVSPRQVAVDGVVPMPYRQLLEGDCSSVDPARYGNFRLVFCEVFRDRSLWEMPVNVPPAASQGAMVYRLDGARVLGPEGSSIDPFAQRLEKALLQIRQGRPREALADLEQAIQIRPFLLRYLLPSLSLRDIRWITGGVSVREWLDRVGRAFWPGEPLPKQANILSIQHQELSDYILCFFLTSALRHRLGEEEESRASLSSIWLLERDPRALASWLAQVPIVHGDPALRAHVERFQDPGLFHDPLPWRKDDFGFGRFMVRLLFHWDIRSSWDRGFGTWV